MKLRYITCSDPREHNSIQSMVDLAKLPNAEIAAQCHPSKMSDGMPRNVWFNKLLNVARNEVDMNLAIHINQEWADYICVYGIVPDVIYNWMRMEKPQSLVQRLWNLATGKPANNQPVIKRVQLNMPKETAQNINADKLARIIHEFPNQEFILQYNNNTKDAVEKLHRTGAKFSLLFDASGGRGIAPTSWQKPIYDEHPMGYSGGLSPDNIVKNLDKINTLVPNGNEIWTDAEGQLKSDITPINGKPGFDVLKAKQYVIRANKWQNQQGR